MTDTKTILTTDSLDHLASVLSAVKQVAELHPSHFINARVSFLRNFTIEGVEPVLKYQLYQSGIFHEVILGEYDNIQ